MIQTRPLPRIHRDLLNRVIRQEDIIAWTNKKYGQSLKLCTVIGCSKEKLRIKLPNGKMSSIDPKNCIVITNQIIANAVGNVGANIDLEQTRPGV